MGWRHLLCCVLAAAWAVPASASQRPQVKGLDLVAVFTGWNIYDTPPLDTRFALDRMRQMLQQP